MLLLGIPRNSGFRVAVCLTSWYLTFRNRSAPPLLSMTSAYRLMPGEIYGLIGPDGSGKTTTMRLLCGALQPVPGKNHAETVVMIAGVDMLSQTDSARAQLGYLPQRFSMYEDLTVLENLRFFAEVRGLSEAAWRPRCMQILEFVGLAEFINRRAGQLIRRYAPKAGIWPLPWCTRQKYCFWMNPPQGLTPSPARIFGSSSSDWWQRKAWRYWSALLIWMRRGDVPGWVLCARGRSCSKGNQMSCGRG